MYAVKLLRMVLFYVYMHVYQVKPNLKMILFWILIALICVSGNTVKKKNLPNPNSFPHTNVTHSNVTI